MSSNAGLPTCTEKLASAFSREQVTETVCNGLQICLNPDFICIFCEWTSFDMQEVFGMEDAQKSYRLSSIAN